MDKHKESESEILTPKEMKNTKGGAVPGAIGVTQKELRDETAKPLVEQESTTVSAARRAKL